MSSSSLVHAEKQLLKSLKEKEKKQKKKERKKQQRLEKSIKQESEIDEDDKSSITTQDSTSTATQNQTPKVEIEYVTEDLNSEIDPSVFGEYQEIFQKFQAKETPSETEDAEKVIF